jgi:hypothetical protein
MRPILLVVGGVFQILIVLLHIGIFFGIASSATMPANDKISAYIFNAAVTVTVIFFGYVSLFRRKDLLNTKLGLIICLFISIFYLQRGVVELFLRGFEIFNLGLCIAIAAIYLVAILPSKIMKS